MNNYNLDTSGSISINYAHDKYTKYGILLLLEHIESKIRVTDDPVIVLFAGARLYKLLNSDFGDTITLNEHPYSIAQDIGFPDGSIYLLTIFKDKEVSISQLENACIIATYSFETGRFMGIRVNNPELQGKIYNIGGLD